MSGGRLGPVIAEALGAIATGHVVFSGVGIAAPAFTQPTSAKSPSDSDADSKRATHLAGVVSAAYSGRGLPVDALTANVTFTDPAASCVGRSEVVEAFRALQFASPEHVQPPHARERPDGTVDVVLHQRYFRGSMLLPSGFEIHSVLEVHTVGGGDDRICSLTEQWNGAPLLQLPVFRWVRRVNGIVSSLVTPIWGTR